MKNHRKALVVIRAGDRHLVTAEYDDHDRLACQVGDSKIAIDDEGPLTPTRLVNHLRVQGFDVECCNECEHFVYAGMGADCGSTIGSCGEGRIGQQFRTIDDTDMVDSCDVFKFGRKWNAWPLKVEYDDAKQEVSINGVRFDGRIWDHKCGKCGHSIIYYEGYDADFCGPCNEWKTNGLHELPPTPLPLQTYNLR
jgi:hypothetical protein